MFRFKSKKLVIFVGGRKQRAKKGITMTAACFGWLGEKRRV